MVWFYISLLASLLWGIATIIDEHTIDKYIRNPYVNTLIYSVVGLIAGIGFFVYYGTYEISIVNMVLSLLAGATFVVFIVAYFWALKFEEVTRVVPLTSLSTIFTLLLATIFLGEMFSTGEYLGMFLIVVGAAVISLKFNNDNNGSKSVHLSKVIILMIIGTFFLGLSGILEKYLMNLNIPYEIVFSYSRIGVALTSIPLFFLCKKEIKRLIKQKNSKAFAYMFSSETITVIGTILIFMAMAIGPVTLVSAVISTEQMFTFIFASIIAVVAPHFLMQEINHRILIQKFFAILLIIAGLIFIS